MLYDYKSDELVQDVILGNIETLVDDIVEEFYNLRRYNELDIYTTSSIAREIISELFDLIDELWLDTESENDLLYKDGNEVLITIANDGMVFVESARGDNGQIKSNEDCSLTYLYDGFGKKDVDELAENAESILVFGFEDDDLECTCDECKCACKDSEEKPECTVNSDDTGYSITVKCNLDADDAMKIIQDMENRMKHVNDMFREMDNFRRLFRW